jgi:anti-sigma factor RsiW
MNAARISDGELHAFIDGALDEARRRDVEAALEADPALAARIEGFSADKVLLKRVYAPLAARPLPRDWIARIESASPARPSRWRSWGAGGAIAAALLLALAGTANLWRNQPSAPGEIVEAALAARATPVRGEKVVPVAADAGIHRYDTALKSAVAMNVKVPDLAKMGYRLAGLHVYAQGAGGRAAELLYRGPQGRLFTLYLRHSDGAARFDQFERKGLRVCIWQDEELGMVMAGNVSTAAMQRLASLAYTGLTL